MSKKSYVPFLILILIILLFTASCIQRITASKYTTDILKMNDGTKIKGIITPGDPQSPFIQIIEDSSDSLKLVKRSKITSIGYSDLIIMKDGDYNSGSIEVDKLKVEKAGNTKEIIEIAPEDIKEIHFNIEENDLILLQDEQRIRGNIQQNTFDVVTKTGHKKIQTNKINLIVMRGTIIEKDQSIEESWNELAGNIGIKNVVPESSDGRKVNGWLYTLIGVLVVFAALILMLIAFLLMKYIRGKKDKTKDKQGVKLAKTPLKGDIPEDVISAIALTLALHEGGEKLKLTFDREKTASYNWAYSGRMDSTQRAEFQRGW
jgi:hypothetical protein